MKVAVVGSSILDIVARPTSRVEADTSNEAEVRLGAGGAGRNVAENLARLGFDITLVTDLADDLPGRFLLDSLRGLPIETRLSRRERTGVYLALLQPDGGLERGFCATGTEAVTPAEVLAALPDLADFSGLVIDANLSGTAVLAVVDRCRSLGIPYALETVAHERSLRVRPAIPGCAFGKPDRAEARMLTGLPCGTRSEAAACARRLRAMGAGAGIVSLGEDGFYLEHPELAEHFPAAPATVADVTGAGDALFAAFFAGLLKGLAPRQAAEAGRRAAALAVADARAVSPGIHPGLLELSEFAARPSEGKE